MEYSMSSDPKDALWRLQQLEAIARVVKSLKREETAALEQWRKLVAIANTAQRLRRNANMLRAVHSNADYIPAYLLAPLYDVLDDLDVLNKEEKSWK